jgi:hypothetical protein
MAAIIYDSKHRDLILEGFLQLEKKCIQNAFRRSGIKPISNLDDGQSYITGPNKLLEHPSGLLGLLGLINA